MNKKSKGLVVLLLIIIVAIRMRIADVFASESGTYTLSIVSESVPESAFQYAKQVAPQHIETFIGAQGAYGSACTENSNFYIGNGFYVYFQRESGIERGDIIDFPIIENNKVVLLVHVFSTNSGWGSNASYGYSDVLSQNMGNSVPYMVVAPNEYSNCALIPQNIDGDVSTVSSDRSIVDVFPANIYTDDSYSVGVIDSPVSGGQSRAGGFVINTDTYKLFQMNYCFVLQNDESGNQRGLCWAATAATMIRYLTGDRSIESFEIANELGIGYDDGGSVSDIRTAIINHGCSVQYEALTRKATSMTEVMHNINNQYPIAMVGVRYLTDGSYVGHAVTIIGYNNGTSLIYWNSATGQMTTAAYSGDGTYFTSGSLAYEWINSVMIPLN